MTSRLTDPKLFMAMKNLQLAARNTVDNFLPGIHKSYAKGAGMEFSQYRSYEPGDDLRNLDWKLFARSDRYYIRESETETNLSVKLLIDASASMNHEDKSFSKIEYARYLAASLAYLALSQGDTVGLYVFENNQLFSLPSRNDQQHLARICFQLENIQPAGNFTEPVHYKSVLNISGKELIIFITDFYEQHEEITTLLQSLSTQKSEVIVFHLLAENEARPDFAGFTSLEDLETGQTIKIDSVSDRQAYQQRLESYISHIKTNLLNRNISYQLLTMDKPLDKALQQFLLTRKNITR